MGTGIEWTHHTDYTGETWNPITGCQETSPGCANCYVPRVVDQFNLDENDRYSGIVDTEDRQFTGTVKFNREDLDQPQRWTKPRMIFVNSMSDLFYEDIPVQWIFEVFNTMAHPDCEDHLFLLLTKRAERMQSIINHELVEYATTEEPFSVLAKRINSDQWPLDTVWCGVTVEDQDHTHRIPTLQETQTTKRFVSCEPLLGPLDLDRTIPGEAHYAIHPLSGQVKSVGGSDDRPGIDWVIAGGESGPNARPPHPDWFRTLRDQCDQYDVPYFFKQWGQWVPEAQSDGCTPETAENARYVDCNGNTAPTDTGARKGRVTVHPVGKKQSGRILDGQTHDAFPETIIG